MGKIIVVGAGAAGIYATYLLRRAGCDDVLCLEAGDDVCGRARAYTKNGFICEAGALGVEPQWENENLLIRELGLWDERHIGTTIRVGFWRKGKLNLLGMGSAAQQLRWLGQTLGFRGASLKAVRQTIGVAKAMRADMERIKASGVKPEDNYFEDLLYLGNTSLADYVLEHGGPEALDGVFRPFMSLMVLGSAEDICITHVIALAMSILDGQTSEGGFLWMERGVDSIFRAAYEKDRECYRLSSPVDEIVIESGRVKGVRACGDFMGADAVICATTANAALDIMPNLPETIAAALETVRYSSSYNYMFGSTRKFTPEEFVMEFFPVLPGEPEPKVRVMFDSAQRSRSYAPNGKSGTLLHVMTSYEYKDYFDSLSEEERLRAVKEEARKVFPDMPEKLDIEECVHWEQAISLDAPGQITALSDYERNHVDDIEGLYLAGEYLYPVASCEGACISSKRAVERLLGKLGIPMPEF